MLELLRLAGLAGIGLIIVILTRVVVELIAHGKREIRDLREEGGGLSAMVGGELRGGQRSPSISRAHGLHPRKTRDGRFVLREKSVFARRPF